MVVPEQALSSGVLGLLDPGRGGPVGHPGVPPGDHQGIARTLLGLFTDCLPIFYSILSLLLAHVSMFMFVVMSMFTFRSSTGLNVAVEPRQKTIMNPPSNKREGGGGSQDPLGPWG